MPWNPRLLNNDLESQAGRGMLGKHAHKVAIEDYQGHPALCYAAGHGYLWLVKYQLKQKDVDVNVKDKLDGDATPLYQAVKGKYLEIIELLLKSGADVHARTSNKETPLHLATDTRDPTTGKEFARILELLLRYGAKPGAQDINGFTAFHWAAHYESKSSVPLLMRYVANINAQDINGNTPLDIISISIQRQSAADKEIIARLQGYSDLLKAYGGITGADCDAIRKEKQRLGYK